MKRWNNTTKQYETNQKIDQFISEVIELCKKHSLSISHEDEHGNFIIEPDSTENFDWLAQANDSTDI